jgi:16S rRNA processing protein RimM
MSDSQAIPEPTSNPTNDTSGGTSGESSSDALVAVGRILGAHGSEGEIRVRPISNVPSRFDEGNELLLSPDGITPEGRTLRIVGSRSTISKGKEERILLLRGFRDRDQALQFIGEWLYVKQSEVPAAEEGEYFHYQLLGLKVRTVDGDDLGELSEILETGSNDVYIVVGSEGEILVPAVSQVVCEIDIDAGVMVVDLPEGLR